MVKNFDEFVEKYKPQGNHIDPSAGCTMEIDGVEVSLFFKTYGDDLEFVHTQKPEHVWTVIESDDVNLSVVSGYHVVNRFAYFVCEKPYDSDQVIEFPFLDEGRNFEPETEPNL